MSEKTKGKCKYCGKEYTKGYMYRHLKACKKRAEKLAAEKQTPSEGFFLLEITSYYESDYWLIVEISEDSTLRKLDEFLRDIWLECCGHLSAFTINGTQYNDVPDNGWGWGLKPPSRSLNIKLKNVLSVGMNIKYEYDFGSTTRLTIKVKDFRKGGRKKEKLTLISRNNPIEHACSECGKTPADFIYMDFLYGDEGISFLCASCADKHEEYDEMLLPVCNSPRMGVCAYEGSEKYPDRFEPDV
ncbi:MAG: plasmid pRiA4b ORF-3 family protein [Clostridiales bacterium]|nr:plasmid pRiA4b ORF-3 family protein [Clostridiales bacterium]